MRISRLYTTHSLNVGHSLELDEDNAHYVRTVLRLKTLDKLTLFNGTGGEYLCELSEVSRKTVRLKVIRWLERTVESSLNVHIGLGISRGDRMDFSIQKVVELGVYQITPLITERCVVQFKEDKKNQRLSHWQKIIQHATEQSGRTVLPRLNDIHLLSQWIFSQQGLKIFLDPYAENTLNQLTPSDNTITLLTGAEGGFSETERDLAKSAGFVPVRLGARVLRTETASLAALSAVQMLWGDFN